MIEWDSAPSHFLLQGSPGWADVWAPKMQPSLEHRGSIGTLTGRPRGAGRAGRGAPARAANFPRGARWIGRPLQAPPARAGPLDTRD
jgi:hypothetical protein